MSRRTNTARWEEKRSRWRIDVQKNGIRKSFYSSAPGRQGMRDCHAKADAWLDEGIVDRRKKVKDMAALYLDNLINTTSQGHWKQYDSHFRNYILPTIGNIAMEDLTEIHIQSVITKAHRRKLSRKSLLNIRACLQNFVKFCRKARTTTLMCEDIIIPKDAAPSAKKILQPEDIRKLFSCSKTLRNNEEVDEPLVYAWRFAVLTGLRPGEILGLQRGDVFRGTIHIQRSINIYGETTTGKNDNARRTFELPLVAQALIARQLNHLDSHNITTEWLFPDRSGKPPRENHYAQRLKRFCEYNGISYVSPYELRHTFVSISKSVDTATLKTIVGHSTDMDTFGVYGHTVNGELSAAAEQIDKLFGAIFAESPASSDAV